MKTTNVLVLILLSSVVCLSNATDVQGTVYGTWNSAGSPYNVIGDLEIPYGFTLVIEPGVEVVFQDHYQMEVRGKLTAVGTEANMISFTAASGDPGWAGIRFTLPDSDSEVTYCILEYGNAYAATDAMDEYGGAMLLKFADITITHNIFRDNKAQHGGAIANWGSNPIITDNYFHSNLATDHGGAIHYFAQASGTTENNTFWNNTANDHGGAIYIVSSEPLINDNSIHENYAINGAGIYASGSNASLMANSIDNNIASSNGGGIYFYSSNGDYVYSNFISSNSSTHGGGIYVSSSSNLNLSDNAIWDNEIPGNGGGIHLNNSTIHLYRNLVYDNEAAKGGGIYAYRGESKFYNCIIHDNYAASGEIGAGVYLETTNRDDMDFINCDIVYNENYGLYHTDNNSYYDSNTDIINCVIFFNIGDQIGTVGHAIINRSYSDVAGYTSGTGNFSENPDFIGYTNFYLLAGSPCIDAGNPNAAYNDVYFPPSQGTEVNDVGASGGPYSDSSAADFDLLNHTTLIYPISSYTTSVSSGMQPLYVDFTNTSFPGNGTVLYYKWCSDDGFVSYENSPSHAFNEVGEHTVYLEIATENGVNISTQVITVEPATGTSDESEQIGLASHSLGCCSPNPISSTAVIPYSLANPAQVEIAVYDLAGHKVAVILNENMAAGSHSALWNPADISAGVYLYSITADGYSETRRCVIIGK